MYRTEEGRRVVVVKVVPATFDLMKSNAIDRLRERPPVRNRNDRIAISPENGHRREMTDFMGARQE